MDDRPKPTSISLRMVDHADIKRLMKRENLRSVTAAIMWAIHQALKQGAA